jgi:hypothetical protein
MPEDTSIFSALAARLNDADLIEAWLLIPENDSRSPFDIAIAAELGRRYVAGATKDDDFVREKTGTPRLYAGW